MLNGILNVRKEAGWTSNDAVAKLRGVLHTKKAGHTGTLDPDAEGVLPVCFGSATKLVGMLTDCDKEYVAVCRLGVRTDTQDLSEGSAVLGALSDEQVEAVLSGVPGKTPEEVIRAAAAGFVGEQLQVPPMYSAKKVAGHKLYEYARAGKTVERKGVPVSIRELEILGIELPRVRMRIRCSKGTYIRTLVSDIGDSLGTGAAMESLLRTRVGEFVLDGALRIGEIEAMAEDGTIASHIVPVEACFASCPAVRTRACADRFLYNGNVLHAQDLEEGGEESRGGSDLPAGRVRVYDSEGRFCAVYQAEAAPLTLRAEKMFLQS